MAFNYSSSEDTNARFVAGRHLLPSSEGKLLRRLKVALQNPLTFVFLVWAAMFLMTVLFLAFID